MIKLFEGKRTSEMLYIKLADCRTVISPAHAMMFWFYIQAPDGSWKVADVRQLQVIQDPQLAGKDDNTRRRMIVGYEFALLKEFAGKNDTERLQLIARMIEHLPMNYFLSQRQVALYEDTDH